MTIRNHGIGNSLRSAVCASALAAALIPCAAASPRSREAFWTAFIARRR